MRHVIKKAGVFYFKKRIPEKLLKVGAYPGKSFIEFSLGKNVTTAEVRHLAILALAKYELEFKEIEAQLFPTDIRTVMLNRIEIEKLVTEWEHHRLLSLDELRRFSFKNDTLVDIEGRSTVHQYRDTLLFLHGNMKRQKASEELKGVLMVMPRFFQENARVTLVGDKRAHDQLASRLQDAEIRLLSLAIRKLDGDVIPASELPQIPSHVANSDMLPPAGEIVTVERLFQLWRDENRFRPSIKTVQAYERTVKDWSQFCNKVASDILRSDALAWVQHLAANKLSIITVGNKILHMSALFNVGMLHGRELGLKENPFKSVAAEGEKLHEVVPWYISNLTTLLRELPLWKNENLDEACQWVTLICYTTGMRLEEASQLVLRDILVEDGRHCIRIHGVVDFRQAADGTWPTHHVKNDGSRRRIPIHKALIRAGFIKYCDKRANRLKGDVDGRLFPALKRDKNGILSSVFSKLFGRWAKQLGIKGKEEGQVFHSYRHLFKDLCRIAGTSDNDAKAYMGHGDASASAQYGATDYPLAPLCKLIDSIELPVQLPVIIK
ncbi:MAG: tyrosine-type recombinase/integrase [Methylotenera sp.]